MLKLNSIIISDLLLFLIIVPWCSCASTSTSTTCGDQIRGNVTLMPVDYSNATLMTSLLPRSDRVANKTTFNFNDFGYD